MVKKLLSKISVLFSLFAFCVNAYAEKRVALIIGNSEYGSGGYSSLSQPIHDAEAFDRALKSFGFETILVKNGNLNQMLDSLSNFVSILDRADVAVFYYSGHGKSLNYLDYIVPSRTTFKDVAIEAQVLSLEAITREMYKHSKLSFVFYDACRNQPNADVLLPSQARKQGIKTKEPSNQIMICYATLPGKEASAGNGSKLSPFTEVILDNIYKQVEFRTLWHYNIKTDNRLSQMVDHKGGFAGNFYFNRPPMEVARINNPSNTEIVMSNNPDSIQANNDYLISQLDFKGAIKLLNELPRSYHNHQKFTELIPKYMFFLNEQEEGRIVSSKLANAIASYPNLEPFYHGQSRLTYVSNNIITNGFVSTKGDVCFFDNFHNQWAQFSDSMSYCSNGRDYLTYLLDHNLDAIGLGYKLGSDGSVIKSLSYCSDKKFSEGLLAVQNNESGEWGYIDKQGNIIIKCIYDVASDFSNGLAFVRKGDNCYYINKQGKTIIKNFYGSVNNDFWDTWKWIKYKTSSSEYVLTDRWGGKWSSFPKEFSKNGFNVIVDYIMPGRYDIYCVKAHYTYEENKHKDFSFFIKGDGSILYDFEMFDNPTYFCEERAIVLKDGLYAVINLQGQVSIPYGKFDYIGDFHNGLAVAAKNGKYGFIDANGDVVIDFIYDFAAPFTDVFALVAQNGRYGFVDKYGFSTLTVDIDN